MLESVSRSYRAEWFNEADAERTFSICVTSVLFSFALFVARWLAFGDVTAHIIAHWTWQNVSGSLSLSSKVDGDVIGQIQIQLVNLLGRRLWRQWRDEWSVILNNWPMTRKTRETRVFLPITHHNNIPSENLLFPTNPCWVGSQHPKKLSAFVVPWSDKRKKFQVVSMQRVFVFLFRVFVVAFVAFEVYFFLLH